jgi:prefoldin subunit 5
MSKRRKPTPTRDMPGKMASVIQVLTRDVEKLTVENQQLRVSNKTFLDHARTLTVERNQLRKTQLLARINMVDFDNLRASLATVRAAQEEINTRLTAIQAIFTDAKNEETQLP